MKSRSKFVNTFAGDVHLPASKTTEPAEAEFTDAITKKMSEQNRHIETINTALDRLLDGEISPEEYLAVVSAENEKLSNR